MIIRKLFSLTTLTFCFVVALSACATSTSTPPTATTRNTSTPPAPTNTMVPPQGICAMISIPEVEAVLSEKVASANPEKISDGMRCTFVMEVKLKVAVISLTSADEAAFTTLQKNANNPTEIKDFGAKAFAQKTDSGASVTFFKGTQIGQIAVSGTKDNLAVATTFARLLSSRI